jgi:hypothetical protein
MTTASRTPIMHFTHVANLSAIVERGGLLADTEVRKIGGPLKDCADAGIKGRRQQTSITVPPGGCVADYVPFYFAPRSPMLFRINKGGVSTYPDGQEPLVYLVSSVEGALSAGLTWVGSDGNCATSITRHYNSWPAMKSNVDWKLMGERIWKNTDEDGDRMRRRQAEFLVHKLFPLDCIEFLAVINDAMVDKVRSVVGQRFPVVRMNSWYY